MHDGMISFSRGIWILYEKITRTILSREVSSQERRAVDVGRPCKGVFIRCFGGDIQSLGRISFFSMSDHSLPCKDFYGNEIDVPISSFTFRPSVYGLIEHQGCLLLCNTRSTGRFSIPGGGIDIGESTEEALKREVFEECGIRIEIDRFIGFEERFFYCNPVQEAWHVHAFFYLCRPITFDLVSHDPEDEAEKPRWVQKQELRVEDFQAFGDRVMGFC